MAINSLNPPQYNLNLEEALLRIEEEVSKNEVQTHTAQLQGMTPDEAYNVGYETAIHDLRSLTGPNPIEVGTIVYTVTDPDA